MVDEALSALVQSLSKLVSFYLTDFQVIKMTCQVVLFGSGNSSTSWLSGPIFISALSAFHLCKISKIKVYCNPQSDLAGRKSKNPNACTYLFWVLVANISSELSIGCTLSRKWFCKSFSIHSPLPIHQKWHLSSYATRPHTKKCIKKSSACYWFIDAVPDKQPNNLIIF